MFGTEYWRKPETLMSSFSQMHGSYKKISKKKQSKFFQQIYLRLFGIPEIGFQIRSLHFEKVVNEKLKNKKIKQILDAGSGIGTYSFYLAKKFGNAQVFGGDIDQEKIEASKTFASILGLDNVRFGKFDVVKTKQRTKYDLIVTIDVLEHIEDYKTVLKNLANQLIKGGYIYIHTPQPNQRRIFKSMRTWEHDDHEHEGYEPHDLVSILENLGFRIEYLTETFGFFGKLAWELNHMSFAKGFVISGLLFPFLYQIANLDLIYPNRDGLGTAILAKKIK